MGVKAVNLDVLLGVVTALMAVLGGIVSAHAPNKMWQKLIYGGSFVGLGIASIVLIIGQTRAAEAAQRDAQERQRQLQAKLDTSLLAQEYTRGQLDSIGLMMKRVGEKTTDPVVGQMAGAIVKMADNARTFNSAPSTSEARLQISYEQSELDGRTIEIPATLVPQVIQLSEFQIKNVGTHVTGGVTARIYFSRTINSSGAWEPTPSDEPKFPFACFSGIGGGPTIINPQETWNWPAFSGQMIQTLDEPISVKLKVFYGSAKPTEVNFTIRKKG